MDHGTIGELVGVGASVCAAILLAFVGLLRYLKQVRNRVREGVHSALQDSHLLTSALPQPVRSFGPSRDELAAMPAAALKQGFSRKARRLACRKMRARWSHAARGLPCLQAIEGIAFDAIIIGSGVGGLTAGAILARAGRRVLVLEQHDIAGGCLHAFEEEGFEFEPGVCATHGSWRLASHIRPERPPRSPLRRRERWQALRASAPHIRCGHEF